MLVEVNHQQYFDIFKDERNPFLKKNFILLNSSKVDQVLFLVNNIDRPSIGLILGQKNEVLLSPFSAPFGGFNYLHENIYISEIEKFVIDLKEFFFLKKGSLISITFPPSIYGKTFNSKIINSLLREKFELEIPDITNLVELINFDYKFKQRNSREYYNQALKNELKFKQLFGFEEKINAFAIIQENRKNFNRPIYMTFDDILKNDNIWPVDFFGVFDIKGDMFASAIFYRSHKEIVYAAFWGDKEDSRQYRPMDFLIFNLLSHYKKLDFKYIDLGISTERNGIPNEGLLRFKETHESISELRFNIQLKRL